MKALRCSMPVLAIATLILALVDSPQPARAQTSEFRAFWAESWDPGFKNAADIDAMVSRAVAGRYNAIIPEVMAMQDGTGGGHGAYWNSAIVPKAPDITPSGFDPLAYLVQRAHANGIEVHPWLVTYRISSTWPPSGNPTLAAHPEWTMVPQASMGSMAKVDGYYVLDPGSPDVQEYLVSIVRELATNYAIDGIHWDYIRYTTADAGYPSDTSYANSGLARFKRITGYTGTPPPTGNASWDDFRRREVTELVRRVRAELASITTNPRQPLRQSAALITWGNAPSSFTSSSAWARFQNWEEWMRLGYLDTGIPMAYYDEDAYPTYYRNWVDKAISWRYQRHMVIGPALYLNTFANSLNQLTYARSKGANGVSTYNYYSTKKPSATDWTWYTYVATNFFTTTASMPVMPWRYPATATEGTLWGRVVDPVTGQPVDNASVQVGGYSPVKTDGNGYYVATLIPAGASGAYYNVTMTRTGYAPVTHTNVLVVAGDVQRHDFGVVAPPTISQHPVCSGGTASFTVEATGEGPLTYQWKKNGGDIADGNGYSGTATPVLTISDVNGTHAGNYSCVVSNAGGDAPSSAAALTVHAATTIVQNPTSRDVYRDSTVTFSVQATGQGSISYRWQKDGNNLDDGGHYSGTATVTLTVTNVSDADAGMYRCVVTAGCGDAVSTEAALTIKPMLGDLDNDGDVDLTDFAAFQTCFNGPNRPPAAACAGPADFNNDGAVDLADFSVFQLCFNGPNVPPATSCPRP